MLMWTAEGTPVMCGYGFTALNTENLQLIFIRPIINSTAATEKAQELPKVIVRLSTAK